MTGFHIRRPLRKARGTQYYRDRSDRGQGTYCGLPETDRDIGPNDRIWDVAATCQHCLETRGKERLAELLDIRRRKASK